MRACIVRFFDGKRAHRLGWKMFSLLYTFVRRLYVTGSMTFGKNMAVVQKTCFSAAMDVFCVRFTGKREYRLRWNIFSLFCTLEKRLRVTWYSHMSFAKKTDVVQKPAAVRLRASFARVSRENDSTFCDKTCLSLFYICVKRL